MKRASAAATLSLAAFCLVGCGMWREIRDRPVKKRYISNEYPTNPVPGLKKVGVVVLDATAKNEVDLAAFSAALHAELQNLEGLEVIPDAMVLAVLQEKGFALPRDGLGVVDALLLDGLFVAIITQYNPYGEPVVALGLTLFSRAAARLAPIDLDKVIQGGRPLPLPEGRAAGPVTAVFAVYDASQQTLRGRIRWFAEGRTASDVGLGWERYYRSMPNYMQFVSYEIIWKLFTRLDFDLSKTVRREPPGGTPRQGFRTFPPP